MSSASEAELGALYINTIEAVSIRNILMEMGHPQPKTPVQTDNTTALGVVTSNIQSRRTKEMDMRFHWLRDRQSQGHFHFYWTVGKKIRADYWTKHHCAAHHQVHREIFLTPAKLLNILRKSEGKKTALLWTSERVC